MKKPGRPLGLSLAIMLSLMLFSCLPLTQATFIISLRQQFAGIELLPGGGAAGGSIEGVSDARLVLSMSLGVIFLVIALMAWRGRPQSIRRIFVGSVLVMTLITIGLTVAALNSTPTLTQGIDSSDTLADSLLVFQLVISVLVTLYVVWYVNRGPARAFFRGYYLPEPEEADD